MPGSHGRSQAPSDLWLDPQNLQKAVGYQPPESHIVVSKATPMQTHMTVGRVALPWFC